MSEEKKNSMNSLGEKLKDVLCSVIDDLDSLIRKRGKETVTVVAETVSETVSDEMEKGKEKLKEKIRSKEGVTDEQ